MECSIVIASRNHATLLSPTLASIRKQKPPFGYELIVVDDGSTDETPNVCKQYGVTYLRLESDSDRNPSVARNAGYRAARGRVVITIGDDVVIQTPDAIERLVRDLHEGEFLLGTIYACDQENPSRLLEFISTKKKNRWPFYLGSILRRDLYAVGGNDEEFREPCGEDDWFVYCLICGLKLKPRFTSRVVGHHQWHPPRSWCGDKSHSRRLLRRKRWLAHTGKIPYCSSGGPWQLESSPQKLSIKAGALAFLPPRAARKDARYLERYLDSCMALATADCQSVVEFGCRDGRRLTATPCPIKIGVEVHEPYLDEAIPRDGGRVVFLRGDAREAIRLFPERSIDAVLMIDFIEHLEDAEAHKFLEQVKLITRKRIVVVVPYGECVQWIENLPSQTHRSTWFPGDLERLGFSVAELQDFRRLANTQEQNLTYIVKDTRAIFAVWEPAEESVSMAAKSESATSGDIISSGYRVRSVFYDPAKVVDGKFTVDTLTQHIRDKTPCCHIRYGDGEFISALRLRRGRNCDGHGFFRKALGPQLRQILFDVAAMWPNNATIYVGLDVGAHQKQTQRWVHENGLVDKIHWTGTVELHRGLYNLKTLELVRAVQEFSGPKILIGNEFMAPIARAIGAGHIVVPLIDCFTELDRVEQECLRAVGVGRMPLVLASMGMASKPLLWRLYNRAAEAIYIDTGSIFDGIVGRNTRTYLETNLDGIQEIIRDRYRPFFGLA